MKRLRWYGWAAILGVFALLLDVYAYGGLLQQPQVGQAVAVQARREAPMMHTYLVAGQYALRVTPFMRNGSRDLARAVWGEAYVPITRDPALAAYLLDTRSRGFMHALMRPLYWLAPLLLLLALLGFALRPRRVSLIRNQS